jgi:hypothetical protein
MKTATKGNEAEAMLYLFQCQKHGSRTRQARPYTGLAHIFGVYFPPTRSVYLVPLEVAGFHGWLRLEPTRNNQQKGVQFAADFEIGRWSVERLLDVRREAEVAAELELNFA